MKRKRILCIMLSTVIAFIISGCSQKVWYKYGVTPYEFEIDKQNCLYEAEKFGYVNSGYQGYNINAALAAGTTDGIVSAFRQNKLFNMCMEAKGYSLQSNTMSSSYAEQQTSSANNQDKNISSNSYPEHPATGNIHVGASSPAPQVTATPSQESLPVNRYRKPRKPFVPKFPSDFED